MAEVGEIRAKLVAETDQFEAGMARAADATSDFSKGAAKDLAEVNQSLKGMRWAEAGAAVSKFGGILKGAGDDFLEAASRVDDLSDSLKGAFGDNADQVVAWSEQIGTAFGVFTDEQIGGAAVALEKFGATSEANLKRVADIAAATGQPVESIAIAFGKFQKFSDDPNKVAGALAALQKQTGVTAEELGRFGAVLDSNGKVLADTPARAEAARAAMEQLLDEKFSGAMLRQSDASAQLAGHMELLKQELGASALELKENMAPAMLEFVDQIRGLPGPLKGALELIAEFGGTGLQAAGGAIQMAANLKNLGLSLSSLQGALGAAQGALGALAGPGGLMVVAAVAVVALAVAFHQYTVELENANKAAEDLLSTEEKRNRALHANKELIGKTADEYRKLGKSVKDADAVILGLQEQLETARANGASKEAQDRIRANLSIAQQAKQELVRDKGAPKYTAPAAAEKPVRVEESEKQKSARQKKEASKAEQAAKKAERDRQRAEQARQRAQRQAEAKRAAEEAKRQREMSAAERARERRRMAEEKKREREKAAADKLASRQQTRTEAKAERQTVKAEAKAAAPSAAAAAAPGFFDKFGIDDNTKAFKEIAARNAARAAGEDVILGGPSRAGALGAAVASFSPGAVAGASSGTEAGKPGAQPVPGPDVGQAVANAVKATVPETIRIILEQRGEGRTQTQTQDVKRGEPVRFEGRRLGGPTA